MRRRPCTCGRCRPERDRWERLRDWLLAMPAVNYATVLAKMDELEKADD